MSYVITDGQVRGLNQPWSAPTNQSVRLSTNYTADYATLWRTQPHLRTVIGFLARNIAQIGLHVFERVSDSERRRLADHPLARLIGRPNPRTTTYKLFNALVSDLAIYDVACWLKMDGPRLVRLPPTQIEPVGETWLWADGVKLRGQRGERQFGADEIVLFHGYNPTDSRWGSSPIESLRQVLAEEWNANQYREQLWRNGARFPGYIKRPLDAPDWSESARRRFRESWRGLYTGDGPAAGGTPILEDGMEFHASGITPLQAQYLETRKLSREEVAAAYHIPQPMVGILDHATFSNVQEQHKHLYQDTLGPWLEDIQQEIELQLVPDFDDSGLVYVEFNLAEKMKGSFEEQAATLQTMVGAPVMSRNEGRSRLNLPRIEGGDELVTPLNVLIGGQASPRDSAPKRAAKGRAPETHDRKYEQILRAHLAAQRRGILANVDVPDWWDPEWDTRLAADLGLLHVQTAAAAGRAALAGYGFGEDAYAAELTYAFLARRGQIDAEQIHRRRRDLIRQAVASRAAGVSVEEATTAALTAAAAGLGGLAKDLAGAVSAWGVAEAGRQNGAATKRWIVTSKNARPSHAAMHGQTVALDGVFPNGLKWPGDSAGTADEVAGCTCELEIEF